MPTIPCPKCGVEAAGDAKFCENCGTRLVLAETSPAAALGCRCGAGPDAVDAQGYCGVCGRKQPALPASRVPLPRDHVETALTPNFAAVTDRGTRHAVNQDAFAVACEEIDDQTVPLIVVCDGVSSAQEADTASALAASTMLESLRVGLKQGLGTRETLTQAVAAAHDEVLTIAYQRDHETLGPPGTTLVAAIVRGQALTIGWVGDSRAYRTAADGAFLLTRDHSWVNEVVDSGQMTEEEALRSKQAHAITRCVGPLNGDEPTDVPEPSIASYTLPPGCRLIVCSDGLWNYAPSPEDLAALVEQATQADALAQAQHLVNFALTSGGRDNITAAVLCL